MEPRVNWFSVWASLNFRMSNWAFWETYMQILIYVAASCSLPSTDTFRRLYYKDLLSVSNSCPSFFISLNKNIKIKMAPNNNKMAPSHRWNHIQNENLVKNRCQGISAKAYNCNCPHFFAINWQIPKFSLQKIPFQTFFVYTFRSVSTSVVKIWNQNDARLLVDVMLNCAFSWKDIITVSFNALLTAKNITPVISQWMIISLLFSMRFHIYKKKYCNIYRL